MGKYSSILKLKPFIIKTRKWFIMGAVGIIVSSILYAPIPYLTGKIMDDIFLKSQDIKKFCEIILIIFFLYIVRYTLSIYSKYCLINVEKNITSQYRMAILSKIVNLPLVFFSKNDKGYLQGRLAESKNIGNLFSPNVITIIIGLFDTITAIGAMICINYVLAIAVILLIPFFFIVSRLTTSKLTKATKSMLEAEASVVGESFEIINGIEEIKILNSKEYHLNIFKDKLFFMIKKSIDQGKAMIMFMENIYLVNYLAALLVLIVSGIMIFRGDITVGVYTSFSLYITTFFGGIQAFVGLGAIVKPICVNIERLNEFLILDEEDEHSTNTNLKKINDIKISDVSFKYEGTEQFVFSKVNVDIKEGEKIILKGNNGAGKSTLIKLILGLYEPTEGMIFINGLNINDINKSVLRSKIGVVSQKIFIFKGTVLDNILLGAKDKGREDVESIVSKLRLKDYMDRLSSGLDTKLQQNSGLSGGQAQIIAFIRAMLNDKDILILDEPFSNLDIETKKILVDLINNIKNKIVIMILHDSKTSILESKEICI